MRNAADSLGVTLGEYYPDDVDPPEGVRDWHADGGDPARRDAMREEMLVYIERVGAKRRRRRRARAVRVGALGAVAVAATVVVLGGGSPPDHDEGHRAERPKAPEPGEQIARWHADRVKVATLEGTGPPAAGLRDPQGRTVKYADVEPRGEACAALESLPGGGMPPKSGDCLPTPETVAALSRGPALVTYMGSSKGHIVLQGYAKAGLKRIVARRPRSGVDYTISHVWQARGEAGSERLSLRTFVVRAKYGREGPISNADVNGLLRGRVFELMAVYDDGEVSRISGIAQPDPDRRPLRMVDRIAAAPAPGP